MLLTGPEGPSAERHPALDELAEYADGRMPSELARPIETHLEQCARCLKDAEDFFELTSLLRAVPQQPAPRSFAIDEVAERGLARKPVWSAWTSLAASVVLALGMLGALAGLPDADRQAATSLESAANEPSEAQEGSAGGEGSGGQETVASGRRRNAGSEGVSAQATAASAGTLDAASVPADGGGATAGSAEGDAPQGEQGYGIMSVASPVATLASDTAMLPETSHAPLEPTPTTVALASETGRQGSPAADEAREDSPPDRTLATVLGTLSALSAGLSALLFARGRTS